MGGQGQGKGKSFGGKGYSSSGARQVNMSNGENGGERSDLRRAVTKDPSLRVRAVPNSPGDCLTRNMLKINKWDKIEKTWVLEFYGHHPSQDYGCFSNFYAAPFDFVVPEEYCACPLSLQDRSVTCEFSEKAIMLCKAIAMGDHRSYRRIATANAAPAVIKKMGREIQNFDEALWNDIVCSVAFQVVYHKFSKLEQLRAILLATEDCLIAEATCNDSNWGIGIDRGDKRVHDPKQWRGTNILGWALMEVREALRRADDVPSPAIGAAPASSELDDAVEPSNVNVSSSKLSKQEKAFLKVAKKIRDIIKLESSGAGEVLDKLQAKKLEGKSDLFLELLRLEPELPSESDLRSKNKDLLLHVTEYLTNSDRSCGEPLHMQPPDFRVS